MWTMNSRKVGGEYHFYIGAVKIAEICFSRSAKRWKVYLRLMCNHAAYDIAGHYETMADAMRDLHRLLNAPPPEDPDRNYSVAKSASAAVEDTGATEAHRAKESEA